MKKCLLLWFLLLSFCVGGIAQNESTVTIGTGTSTTYTAPFNNYYRNSWTEMIYPGSSITTSGLITSIAFQVAGVPSSNYPFSTMTIYMGTSASTGHASTSSWVPMADLTEVYSTTNMASPTATGWQTFTLDQPFMFDGTENLVIVVSKTMSNYTTSLTYNYTTGATGCVLYRRSDSDASYANHPGSATGTTITSLPNLRLTISDNPNYCYPVSNFTVSNITSTDATVTWHEPDDAGAYILQYKTADETWESPSVETAFPTDTTYNFSDMLSPMTTYNVRVANICSTGDTSYWRNTSFTTACDAVSLPYMQDFDGTGTGSGTLPNCWHGMTTYSTNNPYVSSTYHNSGNASLYFYSSSSTYSIAALPLLDVTVHPINTLQLTFMMRSTSGTSSAIVVGVMTNPDNASTFEPVDTLHNSATGIFEEKTAILDQYTGNGQYVALKLMNPSSTYSVYVDDVVLEEIPACPKPVDVNCTNPTTEGCDVSWTPQGSESSWEVVVVPHNGDVNTGTPEPAYAYPYTITNLYDDTQYDVYVRANCDGGDYSSWSQKGTFTTNPLCTTPLNVGTSQVTGTSALITWSPALYGATGYTVGYSESDQNNWVTQSVTGTSCMLSGLQPNTEYDVFVMSECDEGHADSVYTNFTTHCLAGGDPFTEGSISTYHIPVNNFYNYTYSQQIFLSSEIGGASTIDSIAFEYGYTSASTDKTNVVIYMGHTTQSTFSNTSDYIPSTGLQQVYSGNLNCQQGWNTFVLSTPFQYNGTDNLVLVVDDNSGAYDGSAYVFRAHNAGATRSLYYYSDSNNPSPSNPTSGSPNSATSTNRSNVKFFIPCDNNATCVAPNAYISDIDEGSVTVSWVPGYTESNWEMEYRADDDADWTSEGSVTSPHTVSGLTSDTRYQFRIRSVCGGGEFSDWSSMSVRTECSAVSIPYTENFDNAPASGSGYMVTCWTRNTNNTSTAYPYTSSTQHHSGSYSVYFYGTSAYYSYLASPRLEDNVDIANLQVRFQAYKASASYYIQVGIMTDPNDYSSFVQVGSNLSPSTTSTWELMEVNTDSYTGTGRYIAFRIPQNITSNIYIDDITIDVIPTCAHVNNITASNITSNSVDLSWAAGGSETEWEVVYGLAGTIDDPSTETPMIVDNTPEISLNGLSANSEYDVYVRAVCAASDASFWMQYSLTTACGEITLLPLTENFDNMGSGSNVFPNCWLRYNTYSTSTNYPYVSTTYHASGNAALYFYNSSSTYSMAVLPPMDATLYPVNTLQISFQMRSTSSITSGIQVGVMTDSSNVNTFQVLETIHNTATATWEQFDVPLTSYNGNGRFIALKLVNTSSVYSVYLDDLVVEIAPLCDKPTNVTANNITATGADINWIPGGDETDWEVVVVPAGASVTTGTPEQTSSHPFTLSDLDDDTDYDVYVRADCGTGVDFSSWSHVYSFSTPPFCSAPTNVTVSQVAGTSALVTWTPAIFGATAYTIAYTETGMNNWTTLSVTGDSYLLTGLTPETAYTLTITSECDEGTAPTVTKTFTTRCLAGGELPVGNGTSTTSYFPSYSLYDYSYTQQIFLSSEIGSAADISSISFEVTTLADPSRNLQIYLMHTTSASGSSWLATTTAQQVFSGNVTFTSGWNTINFTTPFQYNGTDNLAVIVLDVSGDWTSTNNFRSHTTSQSLCRYAYQDDTPYSISSAPSSGTSTSTRNNVIFGMPCDYTVSCIAPNVYVSDVTGYSIEMSWASGNTESSWELETSTDGSNWTSEGTVTTSPYTLTNLSPNTLYYVRMRSVCGSGEFSNWVTISQRTDCAAISSVPFTENFDAYGTGESAYPLCWSKINTYSSNRPYCNSTNAYAGGASLYFYTNTSGTYNIAIMPALDSAIAVNTLQATFMYRANGVNDRLIVGVMTNPTDAATFVPVDTVHPESPATTWVEKEVVFSGYTGNGQYIAFKNAYTTTNAYAYMDNLVVDLIPSCPKPQNVHVVNVTNNSVELGWTEIGSASSWVIEYGPVGFSLGNGIEVNAYSNPFTISNLTASTTYEFHVKSECGGGEYSNYTTAFTISTECDAVYQLPFTEDFDTYGTGENAYPLCWGKINTYSSNRPYCSSTNAYAGGTSLYFFAGTSGTYNIAVMPAFDASIAINTLQATFMYRANGVNDKLIVGVMTNPTDATTFVPVDTVLPGSSATTWVEREVVFSGYTGNGQYIAFKNAYTTTSGYAYMDNLFVGLIPTCPRPQDVYAMNATTNSIEIGWTEVGSATSWEIVYGAPGFDPDDATANVTTVTATTNPFTISNLNSTTTYEFYVRALCSGTDISYWSNSLQSSTTMSPVGLPYTADFSDPNDGWMLNNGSCPNNWTRGTVDNEAALFVSDNGTTPSYGNGNCAISALKLFTVGTADSITISFDIMVDGEGNYDYFKLFLAPSSQQFQASTASPTSTSYWYHDYSVNAYNFYDHGYGTQSSHVYILNKLTASIHVTAKMPNPNASPTAASTALLALVWKNDGSVLYNPPATITNLTVTTDGSGPIVTTPTVTTVAATAIGETAATLNATITNPDNAPITAKGFEWKTTNGGSYTQVAGTGSGSSFTATLTGLTPSTDYTYRAFITYNGTNLYGSTMTFTTLPQGSGPCNTPTGLTATSIEPESITVTWDNADVTGWNIQYRPEGGQLSSGTSTTNSYLLTGLAANTTYQIQVQADCGNGSLSEWSTPISVTTTGIHSWLENSVTLFPNPAKEYVDIRVDGDVNVTLMEVIDVYGKVIRTVETFHETSLQTTRINVSSLADGMYFVRVTTDNGVVTKPFVKK